MSIVEIYQSSPGEMSERCAPSTREYSESGLKVFSPVGKETLSVSAAIYLAFPEEARELGIRNLFRTIGRACPALFALNEYADLGESAARRLKRGCSQHQIVPLLILKQRAFNFLDEMKLKLIAGDTCGRQTEKVIDVATNDFLLLSRKRDEFSPKEHKTWAEIDSAIFLATCLKLTIPSVMTKAGVDFLGKSCKTAEELREKYSLFIADGDPMNVDSLGDMNEFQRKLRALHGMAMILKIGDDSGDTGSDNLLELPTFPIWAESVAGDRSIGEVLAEQKRRYFDMVDQGGFPAGVLEKVIGIFNLINVAKGNNAVNETLPVEDLWSVGRAFNASRPRTRRHCLIGILTELFR